jgi:hypothetical protein
VTLKAKKKAGKKGRREEGKLALFKKKSLGVSICWGFP